MLRLASLCLAATAVSLLVAACGDDDAASPTASPISGLPTPTAGATATDRKTEGPSDSPGDATPLPTAPGDVPTVPPTASVGTPAVAPEDQGAFVGQFQGQPPETEGCTYDPPAALVTCIDRGLFAIDPPIVGQDISCSIWVVGGLARLIQCTSQEPLKTTYYEIME